MQWHKNGCLHNIYEENKIVNPREYRECLCLKLKWFSLKWRQTWWISFWEAHKNQIHIASGTEWTKRSALCKLTQKRCFAHNRTTFASTFAQTTKYRNKWNVTEQILFPFCLNFDWCAFCWENFSNKYKARQTSFVKRLHIVCECIFFCSILCVYIFFGRVCVWMHFEISPKRYSTTCIARNKWAYSNPK